MYSKELMDLINFSISDGELGKKEKHIIYKKAIEEGVDLDELEIYLDSKLFGAKNNNSSIEDLDSAKSKSTDFVTKSDTKESAKTVSGLKQKNDVFASFSLFTIFEKIGAALKFCFKGLMYLMPKIFKNLSFSIALILAIVVFFSVENLFFAILLSFFVFMLVIATLRPVLGSLDSKSDDIR